MKRLFPRLLALGSAIILLHSPAHAAKPAPDAPARTWEALNTALRHGPEQRIPTFIGQTITVSAGRHRYQPELILAEGPSVQEYVYLRVLSPARGSRIERDVRKVQKYPAAFLEVVLTGIVRSVDVKKREIVVEPIAIRTGAAT